MKTGDGEHQVSPLSLVYLLTADSRSTHFASKDDNLFAGFTFFAPPDAGATLKAPKKNSQQHQMMKEMIKDKVNKLEKEDKEEKQRHANSLSDDDTLSDSFSNSDMTEGYDP